MIGEPYTPDQAWSEPATLPFRDVAAIDLVPRDTIIRHVDPWGGADWFTFGVGALLLVVLILRVAADWVYVWGAGRIGLREVRRSLIGDE